jgi:hypothetical protein
MTKITPQEKFWNWFVHHEPKLFNFDPNQEAERERIFDEIAGQLRRIDSDLTFEFGPNDARREFVISAGGVQRAFPSVISLAAAAPPLARWRVIAFRPRRTPIYPVELGGKRVDPRDVQFSLRDNGKVPGIYLFIPGFREDDADFKQIGYLLLDEVLGEYDVESRLGVIKMFSPQTPADGDRYSLPDLPALFDELVSRLEGRSGKSC